MPVRFPQIHIADSVVNRILNTADEVRAARPAATASPAPNAAPPQIPASTAAQGAELDAQLAQPAPAMPPAEPPQATGADEAADSILAGGSALSGLLGPPRPPGVE